MTGRSDHPDPHCVLREGFRGLKVLVVPLARELEVVIP